MSKKGLLTILSVLLIIPAVSSAIQTYGSAPDILSLVHSIENAAALVFGAIAVICFIVAGVLFLTAQGDSAKLQQARAAVIWGFAGVVVGLISFSIIAIVSSFL